MTSTILSPQTTSSANLYTERVLGQLKIAFKAQPVIPSMTQAEVMYAAGQQSVIAHVEQRIASMRAGSN